MAMGPAQSAAGVAGGCGLDYEANAMRATVTRPGRWRLVAADFRCRRAGAQPHIGGVPGRGGPAGIGGHPHPRKDRQRYRRRDQVRPGRRGGKAHCTHGGAAWRIQSPGQRCEVGAQHAQNRGLRPHRPSQHQHGERRDDRTRRRRHRS